ncbi:MAG: hypothetical protein IGS50_21380 [Synechococcales cyanobacterium C42_A2020_086]|nr:hypothetical protein [Synechococcales cyanobacterium C42_A2020_086]
MNYHWVWSIVLLHLLGCTRLPVVSPTAEPVTGQPVASSQAANPSPPAAPVSRTPTSQTPIPEATPAAETSTRPAVQRDYAPTTPLPQTGTITVRGHIHTLDLNRLIAECPADSGPYALAESTHYTVQICSAEYDPWQPKYYIGQAKDGSGELRITSNNPEEARQLIFRHEGYTYILARDGAPSGQSNAYLEVYDPSGNGSAEALLYLYEASQ